MNAMRRFDPDFIHALRSTDYPDPVVAFTVEEIQEIGLTVADFNAYEFKQPLIVHAFEAMVDRVMCRVQVEYYGTGSSLAFHLDSTAAGRPAAAAALTAAIHYDRRILDASPCVLDPQLRPPGLETVAEEIEWSITTARDLIDCANAIALYGRQQPNGIHG